MQGACGYDLDLWTLKPKMSSFCILRTLSGRVFGLILHVKQTQDSYISLLFFQYKYIPICNTKQFMYKKNYALLLHFRNYVYIGIGGTCMNKRQNPGSSVDRASG